MVDEIKASIPRKPSVVVLSVGGGGLLCGVLKGLHNVGWDDVPVVAMETEGANCLAVSIESGQLATIPAITRLGNGLMRAIMLYMFTYDIQGLFHFSFVLCLEVYSCMMDAFKVFGLS